MLLLLAAPATALADVRIQQPDGRSEAITLLEDDTPLYEALQDNDVQPFDLDYLDVVADGTAELRLTRAQAFARNDPALLTAATTGNTLAYDGETISATRLVLRLGRGSPLTISVTATPNRAKTGEPIVFDAEVGGLEEGESARVKWTFGDGSARGEGERITHRFEGAGTFNVVVGATTAKEPAGVSTRVSVTIGEDEEATPTPTPEASATSTPTSTGGAGTTGGGTSSGTTSTPPAAGGGSTTIQPSPAKPTATPTLLPTPTPSPTAVPFGERVVGELIDTGSLAVAPAAPAAPEARERDATADGGSGLDLDPGAVGLLGVAALFAAGFRLDMRRARHRWAP